MTTTSDHSFSVLVTVQRIMSVSMMTAQGWWPHIVCCFASLTIPCNAASAASTGHLKEQIMSANFKLAQTPIRPDEVSDSPDYIIMQGCLFPTKKL